MARACKGPVNRLLMLRLPGLVGPVFQRFGAAVCAHTAGTFIKKYVPPAPPTNNYAVLSSGGTLYTVPGDALSSAGQAFNIPQEVLSSDGTSYTVI